MYTSYSQMRSIVYSLTYLRRNVSTLGEGKSPLTGTLSATVPRTTQAFLKNQITLQNWYIFFISENGATKLLQTFLRAWENRLLNRNVFSRLYLHWQNAGWVKNLNESVCRRKFSLWLKCELQFLDFEWIFMPITSNNPTENITGVSVWWSWLPFWYEIWERFIQPRIYSTQYRII